MEKDLGTYWLRVEFKNSRGYYQKFETGRRFTHGTDECKPLDATPIGPTWKSEADLIGTITYMYEDGNYSCDCNRSLFIARAHQEDEPDVVCDETIKLLRLTLIRPDATEQVLGEY